MSLRYTAFPSLPWAQRLGGDVDVEAARQRVRHDQRRGCQEFILISGCTRPSKFRLPDSTEAAMTSPVRTASEIFGFSAAPSCRCTWCIHSPRCRSPAPPARATARPFASSRLPRANRARGRSLPRVFDFRPKAFALRASRPAAIKTVGFEVFVQLVIAAISTAPILDVEAGRRPPRLGLSRCCRDSFCVRSSAIFLTLV